MDQIARAFYEQQLRLSFYQRKEGEFQGFFASIMEMRYPGDFQRVRPWGNIGDQKNDGYLKSSKKLFQIYAPTKMRAAAAIKKIDEDYHGALPHWSEFYTTWVFVHNDMEGLPAPILNKLLGLGNLTSGLAVDHWGFPEIRLEIFQLSATDMAVVLGPAPSTDHIVGLRFEDLRDVLLSVGSQEPPSEFPIRPVPANKLFHNQLSSDSRILLTSGMYKVDLVEGFFERWHDPTLGDRIAQTFKQHYEALRDASIQPDLIVDRLFEMAGGNDSHDPKHTVAVYTVMAYFFEQCDIFESLSFEPV